MTPITLLPDVLAVEVPQDAWNFRIDEWLKGQINVSYYSEGKVAGSEFLPPGSYEIIGTVSSIAEEQAAQIIPEPYPNYNVKNGNLLDPNRDDFWLPTALESLSSLLRSKGLRGENYLLMKSKP